MKLTTAKLRQMIKEELNNVAKAGGDTSSILSEFGEDNPNFEYPYRLKKAAIKMKEMFKKQFAEMSYDDLASKLEKMFKNNPDAKRVIEKLIGYRNNYFDVLPADDVE